VKWLVKGPRLPTGFIIFDSEYLPFIEKPVDARKVFTVKNDEPGWETWPFDQPFHIKLNFAFGGVWGGTRGVKIESLPQEFVIDYVRVFGE
jgi:hypothetical protein